MKTRLTLMLFGLMVCLSTGADANSSVRGAGTLLCDEFIAAVQDSNKNPNKPNDKLVVFSQFIAGYVTAMNIANNKFDEFPIRDPLGQVITYFALVCSQNMDKPFVLAVRAGLLAVSKYAPEKQDDQLVSVGQGVNEIVVYRSFMVAVQKFLSKQGYSIIPDGLFGPGTAKAIQAFKKQKNIAGNNVPDAFMLGAMLGN